MGDFNSGVVLSGPGMRPRFKRNRALKAVKFNFSKRNSIPRHLSRRSKINLKRNLRTLGEKKYFLTTFAADATTTGTVTDISAIAQGDGDTDREGDQLGIRSIEFNMQTYIDQAGASPDWNNVVRVIVFQWYPTTTPTVNSILTSLVPPAVTPIAPYFHDNRYNFKILLDKRFALSRSGNSVRTFRAYIIGKFKPQIQYNNSSTTGTNKLYVITISDSGAITHPTVAWSAKLNYNDY